MDRPAELRGSDYLGSQDGQDMGNAMEEMGSNYLNSNSVLKKVKMVRLGRDAIVPCLEHCVCSH